ncbi:MULTISPECIES: response regulator [Flavobacterium]|jgi:CheY-like chemotaxis protein|uniref:Response regulator n=1 Tax=Flavobacterium frigidarium TaxID=99286 RepID=A0ABV4KGA7_9FLAO|nr:response regulator [Flavobacterium sp.]MDG2431360.1 response regulator [Flavobacterium sp.]|tara:strand:- start:1808 stop:2206 length:399 start_codon:yes stop_codon:yes gene_type:complete
MLDTILFVDDDPITLMLCKKVISKAAFSNQIITAQNGEEAINLFHTLLNNAEKTVPELIFLDLNMPIMGGWEFLAEFSKPTFEQFHDIKVIVLSSTIDPEDLEKIKEFPMVMDFLPKPISLSTLNKVAEALD